MLAHVSAYWIRQPKIALVESNSLESKLPFHLSSYFSSLFLLFEHLLQLFMWEINPRNEELLNITPYSHVVHFTWCCRGPGFDSVCFFCVCVLACASIALRPCLPVVWYAAAVPGWAEAGAVPRLPGSPDNEGHWEHHHHRGGEPQWNVWKLSWVWGRWVLCEAVEKKKQKKKNEATKCNIFCHLTLNEWSISSFCLLQVGESGKSGEGSVDI